MFGSELLSKVWHCCTEYVSNSIDAIIRFNFYVLETMCFLGPLNVKNSKNISSGHVTCDLSGILTNKQ